MKRLLVLFLLISIHLSAQVVTVFHAGFETGFDNMQGSSGGTAYRDTTTSVYGPAPEGTHFMVIGGASIYGWHDWWLPTRLNLKAGRPYTVSYTYRSLSGGTDTCVFLTTGTPITNFHKTRLGGVIDAELVYNTAWTTVTTTIHPTQDGGYLHFTYGYTAVFGLDNITITGDTTNYIVTPKLKIVEPADPSVVNTSHDLFFRWHEEGTTDSVGIFLGDTLLVKKPFGDSTWIWSSSELAKHFNNLYNTDTAYIYGRTLPAGTKTTIVTIVPGHVQPPGCVSPGYTGTGTKADPYVVCTAAGWMALMVHAWTTDPGFVPAELPYYIAGYPGPGNIIWMELGNDLDFTGLDPLSYSTYHSINVVHFNGRGYAIKNLTYLRDATHPINPLTDWGYASIIYQTGPLTGYYRIFMEQVNHTWSDEEASTTWNLALLGSVHFAKNVRFVNCHVIINKPAYPFSAHIENVLMEGYGTSPVGRIQHTVFQISASIFAKRVGDLAWTDTTSNLENIEMHNCSVIIDLTGSFPPGGIDAGGPSHVIAGGLFLSGGSGSYAMTSRMKHIYTDSLEISVINGGNSGWSGGGGYIVGLGELDQADNVFMVNSKYTLVSGIGAKLVGTGFLHNVYFHGSVNGSSPSLSTISLFPSGTTAYYNTAANLDSLAARDARPYSRTWQPPRSSNSLINAKVNWTGPLDIGSINYSPFYIGYDRTCFFNLDSLGGKPTFVGHGITTAQMKSKSFLEANGFNFKGVNWRLNSRNSGFPNQTIDTLYTEHWDFSTSAKDTVTLFVPPSIQDGVIKIKSRSQDCITFTNSSAPITLCDTVFSQRVDSAKVYIRFGTGKWTFVKEIKIHKTVSPYTDAQDTTRICYDVYPNNYQSGSLAIMVKEDRPDTVVTGLKLQLLGDVGLGAGVTGASTWGQYKSPYMVDSTRAWYTLVDRTMGWVPGYRKREIIAVKVFVDTVYATDSTAANHKLRVVTTRTETPTIDSDLTLWEYTWSTEHPGYRVTPEDTYYKNGRLYHYVEISPDSGSVWMKDDRNGLDYPVYKFGTGHINGMTITHPYSYAGMRLADVTGGNGFMLHNAWLLNKRYIAVVDSASKANLPPTDSIKVGDTLDRTPTAFSVPGGALVFANMAMPGSPNLAKDELTYTGCNGVHHYTSKFRGIYPKARRSRYK